MQTGKVKKYLGTAADSSVAFYIGPDNDPDSTALNVTGYARGYTIYNPPPVEIKIEIPKKKLIPELVRAKTKEQLKVWGLRR